MSYGQYETFHISHLSIFLATVIILFIISIFLLWYAFIFNDFVIFVRILNFIKINYKIILLILPIILFIFFTTEF